MAILNQQRNQKGIQTLGTEFDGNAAAGHGCMIRHTNGKVYCVFARNDMSAVAVRSLYVSFTSDKGITWSAPVVLTTGNWDDDPNGIQLDTTSTTSDIGIVFIRVTDVRTPVRSIVRIGFDQATLALTTPQDDLAASVVAFRSPCLAKTSTGYIVMAISTQPSATVTKWTNASFTTNNWVAANMANFWGGSTLHNYSLSVRRLSNGHLGLIGSVRTAFNGGATSAGTLGNLVEGIIRTDVYTTFSNDDGATWATPQNLTNYAATPSLDLVGQPVSLDANLVQLSDGTIVVAFQEGLAYQSISSLTTLASPAGGGSATGCVYHAGKNYLIFGCDNATNGGVFIYDLTGQTVTRLHTGSTPALWANTVKDLSLSSDGKYLAVAHDSGLEIIDTTNAAIANWTIVPIRTTTSPASRVANMGLCKFDTSGYVLYVAYGAVPGLSGCYGFLIDASNPTSLSDLMTTASAGGFTTQGLIVASTGLVVLAANGTRIGKTDKTTGSALYDTNFGSPITNASIFYDSIHNEYVTSGNGGVSLGINRIVDSGSAFSIVQSFTPSTVPAVSDHLTGGTRFHVGIPGVGVIFHISQTSGSNSLPLFYSFVLQKPLGILAEVATLDLSDVFEIIQTVDARMLKTNTWMCIGASNTAITNLVSLANRGRLRYGYFPYNSGTHQLTTAGVDFYDMVNLIRVGTNAGTTLQKPSLEADLNDDLYLYARRADYSGVNNPFSAINGHVEPDAYKLFMKCRVLTNPTVTIQSRARVLQNITRTLETQARIAFAKCVYMKARIVPINTVTLDMRGRIIGAKQTTFSAEFDVQAAQLRKIRMQFNALTGYTTLQSFTSLARIAKVSRTRLTGHFLVSASPVNGGIAFISANKGTPNLMMRAYILR